GSAPFSSESSALLSRSRAISALEACFNESICWSDSFTFCFALVTNFSSASSASSSGKVICDDVASAVTGEGEAVGDGVAVTTERFELAGGSVVQLVIRHANNARIESLRNMLILCSCSVSRGLVEQ